MAIDYVVASAQENRAFACNYGVAAAATRRDRQNESNGSSRRGGKTSWYHTSSHGRAGYRVAGATERDIEWAGENARVVLQAMQMRRGRGAHAIETWRNKVKWILEQQPGRENRVVGAQRSRCDRRLLVRDDGHRAATDVRAADGGDRVSRSIKDRFKPSRRAVEC